MKTWKKVLRIAKFERFGKLDKFEKIWIDLKKLICLEIESIVSRSRTEFTFSLVYSKIVIIFEYLHFAHVFYESKRSSVSANKLGALLGAPLVEHL